MKTNAKNQAKKTTSKKVDEKTKKIAEECGKPLPPLKDQTAPEFYKVGMKVRGVMYSNKAVANVAEFEISAFERGDVEKTKHGKRQNFIAILKPVGFRVKEGVVKVRADHNHLHCTDTAAVEYALRTFPFVSPEERLLGAIFDEDRELKKDITYRRRCLVSLCKLAGTVLDTKNYVNCK